ncbi:coagulation factor XIII A chain-like [Salarias fasciatus]|uniref:coagulation factor XIII A chain-like n=1 Tax=Salarias fasciatus TaxID=181472 RepID=UPI001176F198|nr:coagulation factor XIII A chain-like [Salarias fasciatus]
MRLPLSDGSTGFPPCHGVKVGAVRSGGEEPREVFHRLAGNTQTAGSGERGEGIICADFSEPEEPRQLRRSPPETAQSVKEVGMALYFFIMYYTGVTTSEFLFRDPTVKIGPNKTVNELITVESKRYLKYLVEQANLHFIATGKIRETGQIVTAMKVVALRNPKLTVEVSATGKVNEEMVAKVQFTNPFSFSLENVYVRMEGPGLMAPKFKYYGVILGGLSLTWSEFFVPQRPGETRVIATLDCAALRQVSGQATVTITA